MFAVVLTSMLCCFKIAALFVSSFVNRSIFWVRSCPGASQIQNAEWRSLALYVVKHRVKHLELLFTFLTVSCSCDPDWWGDQCLYMHTLKLILCCNTFGFYCSTQSFWVGADQFGASWCGKICPLFFAKPLQIWEIARTSLQITSQMFDGTAEEKQPQVEKFVKLFLLLAFFYIMKTPLTPH